jgi:hypothetical protein
MLSLTKILQKTEAQKMNSESEAPRRKIRYTDSAQSKNRSTNETVFKIRDARLGEPYSANMQKSILPPSKSDIGRRFSTPRKSDVCKNISEKSDLSLKINTSIAALKRFAIGPARQINISFL